MRKHGLSWTLAILGALGVMTSYYGIWVIVAYFATGLVWWANLALVASGPVGAAGACLAWRAPRQWGAFSLGVLATAAWIGLWVLCFTVLGFRYSP